VGHFLCGRPSSTPSASSGRCQVGPGTSRTPHVSLTPSWAGNHYAPDLPARQLPPKPVPFLCCDTASHRRINSHRRAIHPSPPRTTRMTPCPPATLSHCIGCGAPWRPVAATCLCLFLAALPTGEIPAMPRTKVLHPSLYELSSHPFACRLTCEPLASRIDTEASRRLATPIDRCQGHYTTTMTTPNTRLQGLMECLCFLLPC
jgi:hypothetical protein